MRINRLPLLGVLFILLACQAKTPSQVTIIDGDKIESLRTAERLPLLILSRAGFNVTADDRAYINGIFAPLDQPMPEADSVTLQIRRAQTLTIVTPNGQQTLHTAARTVGEALAEAGIQLSAMDLVEPAFDAPLDDVLIIRYTPARDLTVSVDGKKMQIKSSAATVGEALAEAGIPLIGLDYSLPSANEALPADGQIRVVRVSESVLLVQKAVPFQNETVESPELELDQQQVLEPGETGLAVSRVRIRYEDGQEAARQTESETLVRPPKKRVVAYGTKIVLKTVTIDGVPIQYWRAISMYATSYSPCRSGVKGQCFSGTASGLPVKRGVVAMQKNWYYALQGMEVYVPGYGRGVIADLGGGFPDGRAWIDLGYSDSDWQEWGDWVTVYFLAPAPAAIPYILQ
jgi:uncharacterized protein YabE (DUF348 family)